jgi:hypothetical protein
MSELLAACVQNNGVILFLAGGEGRIR